MRENEIETERDRDTESERARALVRYREGVQGSGRYMGKEGLGRRGEKGIKNIKHLIVRIYK